MGIVSSEVMMRLERESRHVLPFTANILKKVLSFVIYIYIYYKTIHGPYNVMLSFVSVSFLRLCSEAVEHR